MKLLVKNRLILAFTIVAISSLIKMSLAVADSVYQWVDEKGQTHFSQKAPESDLHTAKEIKIKAPSLSKSQSDAIARERLQRIKENYTKELYPETEQDILRYDFSRSSKALEERNNRRREKREKQIAQDKKKQKKDRRKAKIRADKKEIADCKKRKGINCKTALEARRSRSVYGSSKYGADERRNRKYSPYRGIDKTKRCAYGYLEDCKKK